MNRILVIHRGSLGDFLLLLPSLAAIRREYPDARIELACEGSTVSFELGGTPVSFASTKGLVKTITL